MKQRRVSQQAQTDIDRRVHRILLDAGFREPPVDVARILETLNLDKEFYDLEDPGLLKQIAHRVKVGTKLVSDFLERIKLRAVLLFDDQRVLLDRELPEIKHDWALAHEAGHQLLPWHREFWRGDTLETLDPAWHEEIEAEANYAASSLLVCGEVFSREVQDTNPCWDTIAGLGRRYRRSLTVIARRYVEHGPKLPMILLVSTAAWDSCPKDQTTRVRHIVPSPLFESRFVTPDPEVLRKLVDLATEKRRGGPVGELHCRLPDKDGETHIFHAECFYNRYSVMSLFVHKGRAANLIAVPNGALSARS